MSYRKTSIAICCMIGSSIAASLWAADVPAVDTEFFERHIRPVLIENCYKCHSAEADELRAGLRLDKPEGWRRGGDSGPAVVPRDPEASLLLKAIRYDEDVSPMPPDRKLPAETVQQFAEWITSGAIAPELNTIAAERQSTAAEEQTTDHWAFRPPRQADFDSMPWQASEGSGRVDRIIAKHRASSIAGIASCAAPDAYPSFVLGLNRPATAIRSSRGLCCAGFPGSVRAIG